ncbi:hypothetical protein KZ779_07395 [Escherichia coli]|nr:hypothetical protein [Escherichia coli]
MNQHKKYSRKNNAAISIGGREFNVLNLYKYGVLFNGNRVDESVTKVPTGELEGRSFHIDKNILGEYINNNYLTSDVIDEITVLERLLYRHNNNIKELLKNAEGKNVENVLSRHNDRFFECHSQYVYRIK